MFKVLVIDDEPLICKGLQAMIKRMNYTLIDDVFFTSRYSEAESIARNYKPEIIITDIKMPEITGLELIKSFKAILPDSKFIILSGYSDFDYAREALKLEVVEYLLKPAEREELEEVLIRVINSLTGQKVVTKHSKYEDKSIFVKNILINIFYHSNYLDKESLVYTEMDNIFSYKRFCIGLINADNIVIDNNRDDIVRHISELRHELIKNTQLEMFYFENYKNDFVLIFNYSECYTYEYILDGIKKFVRRLRESYKITEVYGSLSDESSEIFKFKDMLKNAEDMKSNRLICTNNMVIDFYSFQVNKKETSIASIDFGQFEGALLERSIEGIKKNIITIFEKIKMEECSVNTIRGLYQRVMVSISANFISDKTLYSDALYTDFDSFNSIDEIKQYILDTIYKIEKTQFENSDEINVVMFAKKYVMQNFSKSVDMAVVANTVSMNYTYFSKLFKDETGMNFSQYLMMVRMEEAKRLLSNPNYKVYEIAAKVGYNNSKHFNRAFKNYSGVTSEQFRKSIVK